MTENLSYLALPPMAEFVFGGCGATGTVYLKLNDEFYARVEFPGILFPTDFITKKALLDDRTSR